MNENEYSVSEAVRLIGVESHVLRYWEEELQVAIRRSSQGHRVYSQQNIALFCRVKELKEQGIQLRAIRLLLDGRAGLGDGGICEPAALEAGSAEEKNTSDAERLLQSLREIERRSAEHDPADGMEAYGHADKDTKEKDTWTEPEYEIVYDEKKETMRRFEAILKRMIEETMEEQNEKLERAITDALRDELADLYFLYQEGQREAAASRDGKGVRGFLKKYFGR